MGTTIDAVAVIGGGYLRARSARKLANAAALACIERAGLTPDDVLDNITLYWLTNTAASAARLYWETGRGAKTALKDPPPHVTLPVGYTVFPGELFQAPRHWIKSAYHRLIYFNEVDRGGHFAAWEEPQLFSEEMRAAFRSLR